MKVLHVVAQMDPRFGGVGQAIRTITDGLQLLNVYSEVVCLDSPNADFLSKEKMLVHAVGPGSGPWQYSKKLSPWLNLNLTRFDAVIVHGLWLYNGYATYKTISSLRKESLKKHDKNVPRFYVMPHGMLDPYFQIAKGRKLKALRNWLFWQIVENKIVNHSDGLLFTCLVEQQLARQPFRPYHPKKEIVVGLGVDEPPVFMPCFETAFYSICPQVAGQTYFLFLGRIHQKKGIDLLIKAYYKVREQYIAMPKLVIAGPGLETAYGQHLHALVKQKRLEDEVFFTGMLNGQSKWGALYGCEAFVLPSHQENFGIAVVEALACGKPVLISNQVNIWQEIKNSDAGFIAEDTCEGTIKIFNRWLKSSVDQKIEMRKKARLCFENYFAVKPVVSNILKELVTNNQSFY